MTSQIDPEGNVTTYKYDGAGRKISETFGGKLDAQASMQDGVSKYSSDTESDRAAISDSFQTHLQTIRNISSGEIASSLGSEDAKLHEDFSRSLNQTESAMDQWRAAYSKHEALSQVQTYASSESLSAHQDLNQGFVEFLKDKYQGDVGQIIDASEWSHADPRKKALIDEFVKDFLPRTLSTNIPESHDRNLKSLEKGPSLEFEQSKSDFFKQMTPKIGHEFGSLESDLKQMQKSSKRENATLSEALASEEKRVVYGGGVDESNTEMPKGYELMREEIKNEVEKGLDVDKLKTVKTAKKGFSILGFGILAVWNNLYKEGDE